MKKLKNQPTTAFARNFALVLLLAAALLMAGNWLLIGEARHMARLADFTARPLKGLSVLNDSKTVRVGEERSRAELTGYLKSLGYVEIKTPPDELAAGSFEMSEKNTLRLRSNFAAEVFPALEFRWQNKRISQIVANGQMVESAQIEGRPMNTLIYDLVAENDVDIVKSFNVKRIPTRNYELENTTLQAVFLAAEGDIEPPVSVKALARAAYQNYVVTPIRKLLNLKVGKKQGGSTPAMELTRNACTLDKRRTFAGKIREIYIASELTRTMSREDLFQAWVNHIYYGVGKGSVNIYAAETAAREIFGKPAASLDLAEASFLAALMPNPSPLKSLWTGNNRAVAQEEIKKRQIAILDRTLAKYPKRFTAGEIEAAKNQPWKFVWASATRRETRLDPSTIPLIELLKEEFPALKDKTAADKLDIPLNQIRDTVIVTKVNHELQTAAQDAIHKRIPAIQKQFPPVDAKGKPAEDELIAVLSMTTATGEVVTLVVAGARHSKISFGSLHVKTRNAPKSRKKISDYALAMERRAITLLTEIDPREGRVKINNEIWKPKTGVGQHQKTVGECFASSDDGCVTLVVGQIIGLEDSVKFYAQNTGRLAEPLISRDGAKVILPNAAIGFHRGMELSALDLNQFLLTFANAGEKRQIRLFERIYPDYNLPPKTNSPDGSEQSGISPETAYLIFWLMRNVNGVGPFGNSGTARYLEFSRYLQRNPQIEIGCKTGSGPNSVGISCLGANFTVTVELFYPKHSRFNQKNGSIVAAQSAGLILSDFLISVLRLKPEILLGKIPPPPGIVFAKVNPENGCVTADGVAVPFRVGTEPKPCFEINDFAIDDPED